MVWWSLSLSSGEISSPLTEIVGEVSLVGRVGSFLVRLIAPVPARSLQLSAASGSSTSSSPVFSSPLFTDCNARVGLGGAFGNIRSSTVELAEIIGFDYGVSVAGIQGSSLLSMQLQSGVIERSNSGRFWSLLSVV